MVKEQRETANRAVSLCSFCPGYPFVADLGMAIKQLSDL
jgi:hypothetical protein